MMILEIREPRERNVNIAGYVVPSCWRQAARSTDRKMLIDFGDRLPLEMFYRNKREYRIIEDAE